MIKKSNKHIQTKARRNAREDSIIKNENLEPHDNDFTFEESFDFDPFVDLEEIDDGIDVEEFDSDEDDDPDSEEFDSDEEDDPDSEETFDITKIIPIQATPKTRSVGTPGVLTIINSKKNGKRLIFAKGVLRKINVSKKIQISTFKNYIIISLDLPNNAKFFNIKDSGSKGIVYSAGLVDELTKKLGLDFSSRVSITFQKVSYKKVNGIDIAIISK